MAIERLLQRDQNSGAHTLTVRLANNQRVVAGVLGTVSTYAEPLSDFADFKIKRETAQLIQRTMKLAAPLLLLAASAQALDKKALLRAAIPVTKTGARRKLDDAEGISLTVNDSIQFNSCVSLSPELSDDEQETIASSQTLLGYWQTGDIMTEKSFVLFNICQTEYCSYEAEDSLYMVDLQTYMGLTAYRPQRFNNYCEACENAYDWCM
jgi:hypothetical protein